MTVWVTKGLEFPIVCVPTMWSSNHATPIVPDPDGPVGAGCTTWARRRQPDRGRLEGAQGARRRRDLGREPAPALVALARAQHQTIVWWTSVSTAARSGLTRVLFCRDDDGLLDAEAFTTAKCGLPDPERAVELLEPVVRGVARHDLAHRARSPRPQRSALEPARPGPRRRTARARAPVRAARTGPVDGGRSPR